MQPKMKNFIPGVKIDKEENKTEKARGKCLKTENR